MDLMMGKHEPKIPDDLMPLEEAAALIAVNPRTLQNRAAKGEIPKWKQSPKGKPFFSRADLMAGFVKYG